MGGTDKKGMENQKVRSIAEQLSRVHRDLTDATANAEKAVRQLRWVWEGDDATTFLNAWPTTRTSLDLSTGGVDELARKLREEVGEQELTSGVAGAGGDSDGDGIPDRDDRDDDNDGVPDERDDDGDNDGLPDDRDGDDDNDGVPDEEDPDFHDFDGDPDVAPGDGHPLPGDEDDGAPYSGDPLDVDGDGTPDTEDSDDDDDGIPDEDDPEHRDDTLSPFDALEVNAGMTLAEGDKELWDEQLAEHTWGDEDGNHLSVEALGTDASADYQAGFSQDGLVLAGGVTAGAYVAKVSGAYSNSYGTAAEGKAFVGAEGNADAGFTLGADGAKATLGGEAFAGGKAEGSVSQDLGPVDVGVGGEISYGIGAHAEADAEFSSDNIGVSVDIGATLGLGGGIKLDIGFDPPW
jgi:hypothetical protein